MSLSFQFVFIDPKFSFHFIFLFVEAALLFMRLTLTNNGLEKTLIHPTARVHIKYRLVHCSFACKIGPVCLALQLRLVPSVTGIDADDRYDVERRKT